MSKIKTAKEAISMIKDGDVVAIPAAGYSCYPEYLSRALAASFEETGFPKNLTLMAGCGHGIPVDPYFGDAKFGKKGFLKRYIASHPMTTTPIIDLIISNDVEGYCIPQGVLNQLYRCSAANQPGLLTKIGMETYVDPRLDGGKLNEAAKEDIVSLMEIDGEEWLFYKSFPVNVAIIRGTTADEKGNISCEEEPLRMEAFETALAAKGRGGIVIAQVRRTTKYGQINANDVIIPGQLVDAVVVAEDPEETHRQTKMTYYSPYLSGELRRSETGHAQAKKALGADDIICRRAAMELKPGVVINIGLSVGAGIGGIVESEGFADQVTFTLELGTFGGIPTPVTDFGAAYDVDAFVSHPSMFDYYHGNNLDIAFLGTAEIDESGNVNVSKMNGRVAGQGGFIDISQTSKKTVFVSYFTAKGLKTAVRDGKLFVEQEGQLPKFVKNVAQITYSGKHALSQGHEAVYVTERAVFKLTEEGLVLTEIAPGIDIERDVLAHMEFKPIVAGDLKIMDERIFRPGKMGFFDQHK